MNMRPIDLLPKPHGWKFTRQDAIRFQCCARCGNPFTSDNVRSSAERAETRISGLCGPCWDELTADEEL